MEEMIAKYLAYETLLLNGVVLWLTNFDFDFGFGFDFDVWLTRSLIIVTIGYTLYKWYARVKRNKAEAAKKSEN